MSRPVVLAPLGYYLPGFRAGGPVRSMASLVETLGGEFDFRILCADRDMGDAEPYPGIVPGRWTAVGQATVHYTAPQLHTLAGLARIIRAVPHDVLYLNSFLSPHFTVRPLVARRLGLIGNTQVVLAPRGEFSEGALALKSAKKVVYRTVGGAAGLFRNILWQASSEREVADIRAALGVPGGDIRIAPNLSSLVASRPPPHEQRRSGAPLRVLFLGRIAPMKNLDFALRVLAGGQAPVAFSIVGPPEDAGYRAECMRLAQELPAHVTVEWRGPIEPADVPGVMAEHDLFFLPTRGENFGHVIAEALGAGTPVLLSDATPWRGLAALGVGHDLPLAEPAAFIAAIDQAAAQSPQQASARRARAFAYACERQMASGDVEANRQLFAAALERGARRSQKMKRVS